MNMLASPLLPTQPGFGARFGWQEPLATRLKHQYNLAGQSANRLLNTELGLFLLMELLPDAPPEALPDLLSGNGMIYLRRPVWTPKQHRLLSRGRTLLAPYTDRKTWFNALDKYTGLSGQACLFSLNHYGTIMVDAQTRKPSYMQRERLSLFWKAVS